MKQSGYIHEERDTDYVAGTLAGDIVNPSGDWTPFLPKGEKQYKDYKFDTQSCTTFSACNIIETWVNSVKLNPEQAQLLSNLGFFDTGEFNISDRFTAIMADTTPQGQSFQKVWDSIRKDGILAEKHLPFGGDNWAEYHDKSVITDEMKALAKKSLEVFLFAYSWANTNDLQSHLKEAPIHIAIPKQATHATELVSINQMFDTYEPFLKPVNEIGYAFQPFIYLKTPKIQTVEDVKVKPSEKREAYRPKNFILEELVSKEIFEKYGERAWQFLDERMLMNLQAIRDHYGVSVTANSWKWGGQFSFRGFDAYEFRKNYVSQHHAGRAVDFDVKGKTAEEVRNDIVSGTIKLPHPNVWLEDNVNWVHMDVRYSNVRGVYQFNQ